MADFTEQQLKEGARRALAAGDIETAKAMAEAAIAMRQLDGELVANTADGGRVLRMSDGRLTFTSPGYSTSDPATIAKIMEGATPAAMVKSSFDQATIAQNPVSARAQKVVEGVPFVGAYADEVAGAMFGTPARDAMRATSSAMDRQNPVQSMGLQMAGGLLGAAPMVAAAGPAIVAGPATLGGQVAAGAAAGAGIGAIEGAVSGFGRGTGADRMSQAGAGAMIGGGFGAAAGAIGPVMSKIGRDVFARLKGSDVATIAKTFGIGADAAKILKTDLEALDFGAAQRNIATAGPDAMVADAGAATREALDSAISGGGAASTVGSTAINARAATSGGVLDDALDRILGTPDGVKASAKSIAQRTAPIRAAAYNRAYKTPIDYAAPEGRAIEGVLARIPPKTLNAAIEEANDAMRAAGTSNMQIMTTVSPDGKSVTFSEMPNVQQLDEIKKALGALAEKETDALTGRITGAGVRNKALARDLKAATGDAVPSYKLAVKLGGDKIEEDQALDMGRKLFSPSVTREAVADTMQGASSDATVAMKRGIRGYIDDTLARVKRSVDDPDVDTTETLRLINTMSTRDAREKLVFVLGKDDAETLMKEIDAVGKQFATRQAVATGSQTGRRVARAETIKNVMEPGILGRAQRGEPLQTGQAVVQLLTGETPAADMAARQSALADVARALTEKRGPDAAAALRIVDAALQGQAVTTAQAAAVGRALGVASAVAANEGQRSYMRWGAQ